MGPAAFSISGARAGVSPSTPRQQARRAQALAEPRPVPVRDLGPGLLGLSLRFRTVAEREVEAGELLVYGPGGGGRRPHGQRLEVGVHGLLLLAQALVGQPQAQDGLEGRPAPVELMGFEVK